MPEMREYRQFGARYMLMNALSVIVFVPLFIYLWGGVSAGRFDVWFWVAVGVFVGGAVFGLWWQAYRARRMTCPAMRNVADPCGHAPSRPTDQFRLHTLRRGMGHRITSARRLTCRQPRRRDMKEPVYSCNGLICSLKTVDLS
jgi:type VI protein secretion system component VasK